MLRVRSASFLIAVLVWTGTARAAGPTPSASPQPDLERFEELEPSRVFRGSYVDSEADFAVLRAHSIRSIVSLRGFPIDVIQERDRAVAHHLAFFDAPFEALPISPSEKTLDFALDTIGSPANQPVYFHCALGRDRTGLVAALYRVFYQGWSPADAHAEWMRLGFADPWYFRGLEKYFEQHEDPLLYWKRNPAVMATPGFTSTECWTAPNTRGGKDVLCRIAGETLPATELLKRSSEPRPDPSSTP